jgi:hypothetical protein
MAVVDSVASVIYQADYHRESAIMAMKNLRSMYCVVACLLVNPAFAGEKMNTALGGAVAGVAGTIIGEQVAGENGALAGAAIGGALGGAATAKHGNKNEAALGGAVGALGGAAIGNQMGGSNGQLIGAGIGGAAGAAIGSSNGDRHSSNNNSYSEERDRPSHWDNRRYEGRHGDHRPSHWDNRRYDDRRYSNYHHEHGKPKHYYKRH